MNTTPCQDRIEQAIQARARSILRRMYAGPQAARLTAEDYTWLKHNLPEVVTDTTLERALRLAGPAFDHACAHYVSDFYDPGYHGDVRDLILAALASQEEGVA